ncbi:MAG: DUF2088 domain-containing protein [Planctomycetaceae bacterium]|nr:DUF2088 domain-containing protein [Planctomycetaceae bacterium]
MLDICVPYGLNRSQQLQIDEERVRVRHHAPAAVDSLETSVRDQLTSPIDFPALSRAILPDDQIVIALDNDTPCAATLVKGVWDVMQARGVAPQNVTILRPSSGQLHRATDPRCELPEEIRDRITLAFHDPADEKHRAYLATTTNGERVYLARQLVEADFVLPVGAMTYDPVLGFRGTSSVLFPGLSTIDAIRKSQGQGHIELGPSDVRSLRQTIDEVGWLLGVQFTLQVIPAGRDRVSAVMAGAMESLFKRGQEQLSHNWHVDVDDHLDLVIVAVDAEAGNQGWSSVASALASARRLVKREGRILVLSDLADDLTAGLEMLRDSRTPRDALKPLRKAAPDDLVTATQVAQAVDRANVYLMSRLEDDLVEDLFMTPVGSDAEVARLIESCDSCAIIESAQYTYGAVQATV